MIKMKEEITALEDIEAGQTGRVMIKYFYVKRSDLIKIVNQPTLATPIPWYPIGEFWSGNEPNFNYQGNPYERG